MCCVPVPSGFSERKQFRYLQETTERKMETDCQRIMGTNLSLFSQYERAQDTAHITTEMFALSINGRFPANV